MFTVWVFFSLNLMIPLPPPNTFCSSLPYPPPPGDPLLSLRTSVLDDWSVRGCYSRIPDLILHIPVGFKTIGEPDNQWRGLRGTFKIVLKINEHMSSARTWQFPRLKICPRAVSVIIMSVRLFSPPQLIVQETFKLYGYISSPPSLTKAPCGNGGSQIFSISELHRKLLQTGDSKMSPRT